MAKEIYTSSCIAFEPRLSVDTAWLWDMVENPHCTLLYGTDPASKVSLPRLKAISKKYASSSIRVKVTGVATFNDSVVLVLSRPKELISIKGGLRKDLPESEDSYPKYRPHITVGKAGEVDVSALTKQAVGMEIILENLVVYYAGVTHRVKPSVEMKSLTAIASLEIKTRRVRTEAGVRRYGVPIGSLIPKKSKATTLEEYLREYEPSGTGGETVGQSMARNGTSVTLPKELQLSGKLLTMSVVDHRKMNEHLKKINNN